MNRLKVRPILFNMIYITEPIDCEMGAWKPFGQCKCNGGISCLDADGNPNLPHSSTERCVRKRSRPVAKRGAYGGRDDCQRKTEAKPCTDECKCI